MKQTITIVLILCLGINLKAYSLSPQPASSMDISGHNDTELPGWSQGEASASVNLSDNFFGNQPLLQPDLTVVSSERFGKPGFQVKVYPNPATDFIRIEWRTDVQTEVHVELYDLV